MDGKYARGVETEAKILRILALNKEVYQYGLDKEVGVSYRTILRTLHSLEELGIIRVSRKEESEKRGKERNVWEITLQGLLELLHLDEEVWKQIGLIAETHREKLLIFKKWGLLRKENSTTLLVGALKGTLESLVRGQLSRMVFYSMRMKWTEKELSKLVDSMTLGCFALRNLKTFKDNKLFNEVYLKILKSCKKDKELQDFVTSELRLFRKIVEDQAIWIGKAERLFASL